MLNTEICSVADKNVSQPRCLRPPKMLVGLGIGARARKLIRQTSVFLKATLPIYDVIIFKWMFRNFWVCFTKNIKNP